MSDENKPDDEIIEGHRCPVCEKPMNDCDHLVASINLNYSELVAGAIFAHQGTILDLLERIVTSDPDTTKVVGASPVLTHVATLIREETDQDVSSGDAVVLFYPHIMAALSYIMQEDEDVTVTSVDAETEDDTTFENLWAPQPEKIIDSLIERLQDWTEEMEQQ